MTRQKNLHTSNLIYQRQQSPNKSESLSRTGLTNGHILVLYGRRRDKSVNRSKRDNNNDHH